MIKTPFNQLLMDEADPEAGKGGGGDETPTPPAKPSKSAKPGAQEIDYDKLVEAIAKRAKPEPKKEEDGDPEPVSKKGDPQQKLIEKLQRNLEEMKANTEKKDREIAAKETKATVQAALGSFAFASPKAKADALAALLADAKRHDDGTVTGPGGEPLEDFVAEQLQNERAYLLAPKPTNGTGAEPNGRNSKGFDLDSISPNMTEEQRKQAFAAIAPFMRR